MEEDSVPLFDHSLSEPHYGATAASTGVHRITLSTPVNSHSTHVISQSTPVGSVRNVALLKHLSSVQKNTKQWKKRVWKHRDQPCYRFIVSMTRPHSHRWQARMFRTVIMWLIVLSIAAFVFETDSTLREAFANEFRILEVVSSIAFLLEYLIRLYVTPARQRYRKYKPWEARLAWICTWESVIDVMSFSPWFITRCTGKELPKLSVLRALRIVRLLKASPICKSFDVVFRVLYYNADILSVGVLICAVLVLVTATFLYHWKPPDDKEDDFSSIPATMYLSVMMLTGQGGPSGQLPWYTKATVVFTAIFATAQFAIPAAMLAWGFEQEASRTMKDRAKKVRKRTAAILAGEVENVSSSSSDEDDRTKQWHEYEEEVLGSDSSEASSSDGDWEPSSLVRDVMGTLTKDDAKRAEEIFRALDKDGTGNVNTSELATITKHGESAELMMQLDPNGDNRTNMREFFSWLATIKKRYSHQVFMELLRQMYMKSRRASEKKKKQEVATIPSPQEDFRSSQVIFRTAEFPAAANADLTVQFMSSFVARAQALEKEASTQRNRNVELKAQVARLRVV